MNQTNTADSAGLNAELYQAITLLKSAMADLAQLRKELSIKQEATPEPQSEIVRPKEAQSILNCSRSHLDHLSATDPTFPNVIRLGNRWTGYSRQSLMQWIEAKAKEVA